MKITPLVGYPKTRTDTALPKAQVLLAEIEWGTSEIKPFIGFEFVKWNRTWKIQNIRHNDQPMLALAYSNE